MNQDRLLTLTVAGVGSVAALLSVPPAARACYVCAHGAGAGMAHPFMAAVAAGLAERCIATLRFQFPFMQRGSRRPDVPAVAHAAVRAAVEQARRALPRLPLFAGGRSFGGRMASQAQAAAPLDGVQGLAFLGFPLHPAGKPADARGSHLATVQLPILFMQGTRDALADLGLLRALVGRLGERATLALYDEADHAFHVPAHAGRTDADVLVALLDTLVAWIDRVGGTVGVR